MNLIKFKTFLILNTNIVFIQNTIIKKKFETVKTILKDHETKVLLKINEIVTFINLSQEFGSEQVYNAFYNKNFNKSVR